MLLHSAVGGAEERIVLERMLYGGTEDWINWGGKAVRSPKILTICLFKACVGRADLCLLREASSRSERELLPMESSVSFFLRCRKTNHRQQRSFSFLRSPVSKSWPHGTRLCNRLRFLPHHDPTPAPTMSLSSLAPFVAAALRDGVVADVNEKLSASQAQVEANKRTQIEALSTDDSVLITGPGGYPIYFVARLDDEVVLSGNDRYSPTMRTAHSDAITGRRLASTLWQDLEVYKGGKLSGSLLFSASEKARLDKRDGQQLVQFCEFKQERPGPGYEYAGGRVQVDHQFPTEEERDKFAEQLLADNNLDRPEECRGTMTIGTLMTVIVTARQGCWRGVPT